MIERRHPESRGFVNCILIDFYLYDTAKEMEERLAQRVEEEKKIRKKERVAKGELRVMVGGLLEDGREGKANGKGGNWEELEGVERGMMIPHHRTRSIWY